MSFSNPLKSAGLLNIDADYGDYIGQRPKELKFALCHCGHVERTISKNNCKCGYALKWQSAVESVAIRKIEKHEGKDGV